MTPLTAGEWLAIRVLVEHSRVPGKDRLGAALDRIRHECPPLPKETERDER